MSQFIKKSRIYYYQLNFNNSQKLASIVPFPYAVGVTNKIIERTSLYIVCPLTQDNNYCFMQLCFKYSRRKH